FEAIISMTRRRLTDAESVLMVHPEDVSRPPLSSEIPDVIAHDYEEAARLLSHSSTASAALGPRSLRKPVHDIGSRYVAVNKEIETLINARQMPKILAEWLDAIRVIGKFREHPLKATRPEEIHPTEPGEADVLLDALDCLFEFYFVQPAEMRKKREDLVSR